MKGLGTVLVVLGIFSIGISASQVREAPNVSYLIGTFLPGILFLIIGLKARTARKSSAVSAVPADSNPSKENSRFVDSLKFSANVGAGCGIVMMFLGSAVAQISADTLLAGLILSLVGWGALIWGCVNYMRWKGYSGWFGLFGYLLLPGLIVLACFPNRRKALLRKQELNSADAGIVLNPQESSGYRFLLAIVPLGVILVSVSAVLNSFRSNIDPAEWKQVAHPGIGFQAIMPGTPRVEQNTQETPTGKQVMHKFIADAKGKKESFAIVSVRFPQDLGGYLGGPEKLLELVRQDLLTATQGRLKNERRIVLNGHHGLEIEVLPAEGAIIKARIYATKNQLYEISAHVPIIRVASEDVQKFLDSFQFAQP